jgi:hypothetical protein
MHDVNPLSTVMHLKELDRQAMAKLRPLRSDGPDRARFATAGVALVALLRRSWWRAWSWLSPRQREGGIRGDRDVLPDYAPRRMPARRTSR